MGLDSFDSKYGAALVSNSFRERIYFAETDGLPDGFEPPFHSLDLVYIYYPLESLTLKLRVRNLLDSSIEVDQGDVAVIRQDIGTTALFNVKWEF